VKFTAEMEAAYQVSGAVKACTCAVDCPAMSGENETEGDAD
jgi:hypothetical protein